MVNAEVAAHAVEAVQEISKEQEVKEEPPEKVMVVNISSAESMSGDSCSETDVTADEDLDSQDESKTDVGTPTRSSRRKSRTPKKFEEAEKPAKRKKRVPAAAATSAPAKPSTENGPKKKRGRPPKAKNPDSTEEGPKAATNEEKSKVSTRTRKRKRPVSPTEDVTKDCQVQSEFNKENVNVMKTPEKTKPSAEGTDDISDSMEEVTCQLTSNTKVHLARLSPSQDKISQASPVRILSEKPLVIEAVLNVKQTLNFNTEETAASEDLIESSQPDAVVPYSKPRPRSRKRQSLAATQPPPERPVRKAALKQNSLPNINGDKENDSMNVIAVNGVSKAKTNKYGESPLHVAIKKGDFAKVMKLLKEKADVNVKDNAGWTPLHEAAARNGPNGKEILAALVEHGADINAKANNGSTALHDAVMYMSQVISNPNGLSIVYCHFSSV